jgi:hypothetical protein
MFPGLLVHLRTGVEALIETVVLSFVDSAPTAGWVRYVGYKGLTLALRSIKAAVSKDGQWELQPRWVWVALSCLLLQYFRSRAKDRRLPNLLMAQQTCQRVARAYPAGHGCSAAKRMIRLMPDSWRSRMVCEQDL